MQASATRGSRRRARAVAPALAALVAAALAAAAATAAGDPSGVSRFQRIDRSALGLGEGTGASFVPASMSNKVVSVMLQMAGKPVALAEADARSQGHDLSRSERAAIRANLKAQQDSISNAVQQAGGSIVGQTQDAYNGILVHAKSADLPALAALPGVVGIATVGLHTVPTNLNGVPLVGAPQVWGNPTNLTGQGVKVGIIDTGIDYTHADFGGPGTAAAYAAARAASTAPAPPSLFGPGAPKVKGGYDFVGDSYNADPSSPGYQPVPQPDPNPLDCYGHGTHVAGTALGFGVTSSGATYTGPYNASTLGSQSWKVGPGVAPKADLYAYRVFGCAGSTDVVILAINKAVEDGVNVISMSLGSDFGTSDQTDAEAVAVNNAVAAGITVVSAAGNAGPNGYIVSSPSTANHALSVAASDGSLPTYPAAAMALSTATSLTALNANGATFSDGTTLPVKVLRDATGAVSLGCAQSDYPPADVAGKLVVVQRGVCARVARAVYGQKAGAAAVAMINSSSGLPPYEGQITSNPDTGEQYTVTIPFFGVRGGSSPDRANLIAADGGTVSLTNTTTPNTGYKRTASFSSGGPRRGDSAAKPEITAPGVSVLSALNGGGTEGTYSSGTSMATPMTSGSAALVKQAHPSWNGDQVKAALVNTADPSLVVGYNGRVNGSGFVQVQNAAATNAIATTADGLDSLSFGYVGGTGDYTATRDFTVTNTGPTAISYNLAITQPAGASVSASPASFTVGAGGSQDVQVTLTISSAAFAALPSASSFAIGPGQVVTMRGAVTAVPSGSGQPLRMPLLVVPRGLSSVTAGPLTPYQQLQNNNAATTSTTVMNAGIHDGTADVYAWGIHDANDLGSAAQDVRDVGVQTFPDGTVVFAVNTYNQTSTAATQEYDIAVDVNHNGSIDYYVVGVDLGAVFTGSFDGRYGSFTFDAHTGALVDAFYAEAPMNGSTVLLPTTIGDLGMTPTTLKAFDYSVNAYSVLGGSVDTTAAARFDLKKPAVSTGQFADVPAGGSATIPLWADNDRLQHAPALGWLVVSVDNAGGTAQVGEVPLGDPHKAGGNNH